MKEKIKKIWAENQKLRKVVGVFLVLVGLTALVTPFTPGSWLIFVGLELFGLRFLVWDRLKEKLFKNKK